MGTAYVRYVDVDADAGGDGTTSALTGSHCAFKSLSIAEAAGDGAGQPPLNLGTLSDTYTIHCQSTHSNHTADTTAALINGWIVNVGASITIDVSAGSKHNGVWDSTKYRLEVGNANALNVQTGFVNISGLQVKLLTASASNQHGIYFYSNGGDLDSCIVIRVADYSTYTGSAIYAADSTSVYNCVAIAPVPAATNNANCAVVFGGFSGSAHTMCNCTAIGGSYAYFGPGADSTLIKNCYGGGSYSSAYQGTFGKTTCASHDATGSIGYTGILLNTTNFGRVTSGSEVLSLPVGSSLIGTGTTLAEYTYDIVSVPRGTTWDIGAFQHNGPANVITIGNTGKSVVSKINGVDAALVKTLVGVN